MPECDDLQSSLSTTEAQILRVDAALEDTTDPDEARRLATQLALLQSQRTQLKILINQKCTTVSRTLINAAPDVDTVMDESKRVSKANRKLIRKHRRI